MATQKQLKAAEKLVENGGNVSQAMVDAGYSEATAHTPGKLTNSQGFKSVVEELQHELGSVGVTPKRIARVIKQGLAAKQPFKIITIDKSDGDTKVSRKTVEKADHKTRHMYLDTAVKVMGGYPQQDTSPTTLILAQFKAQMGNYMEDEPQPTKADNAQEAEVVRVEA